MKRYDFFNTWKRLFATGLAARGRGRSKHAKGRTKSPFWKVKRKRLRKLRNAARKLTRPRHTRRRRVVSKGKSVHSAHSW